MNPEKILDYCIYVDNNQFCSLESKQLNGFCDKHQNFLSEIDYYKKQDRQLCISIIKQYLCDSKNAHGRHNKASITIKIYDFLCRHKYFIHNNENLEKVVLERLYHFDKIDKDIIDAQKYIRQLFPLLFDENND